jgi:hypothetical protein
LIYSNGLADFKIQIHSNGFVVFYIDTF